MQQASGNQSDGWTQTASSDCGSWYIVFSPLLSSILQLSRDSHPISLPLLIQYGSWSTEHVIFFQGWIGLSCDCRYICRYVVLNLPVETQDLMVHVTTDFLSFAAFHCVLHPLSIQTSFNDRIVTSPVDRIVTSPVDRRHIDKDQVYNVWASNPPVAV